MWALRIGCLECYPFQNDAINRTNHRPSPKGLVIGMTYTLIIARASWTWRECIYLVSSKGILRIFQLFSFRTASPLISIAWATWIPLWWCSRNIPTWLIKHPAVQGLKIVLTLQKSGKKGDISFFTPGMNMFWPFLTILIMIIHPSFLTFKCLDGMIPFDTSTLPWGEGIDVLHS